MNDPGRYDEACTLARKAAGALGAVLMIFQGKAGDGFEVQLPADLVAELPRVLRDMADDIEKQLAAKGS